MRQLIVRVPPGRGPEALAIARDHGGANLACFQGQADGKDVDLAILQVSNARVEPVIGALQNLPDLHVTLAPRGVISLRPPAEEAPDQATDVEPRSPIEIYLGGLQSVGSWTGFLGYAAAAGVVVWIGLFTNTIYLLTAAMLIAPFAGPAMNAALATARGDAWLLGRSLARYSTALAVTIACAFGLSLALGQDISTAQMVERSQVSSVAVLLPLVAGAAGALNLCQSDRNSLVSGAATGMLVAASLAPPAGLVGMSAAIGEWSMAKSGAFVLLLQILGINLAGAVVFRLFGLSPQGVRFAGGRRGIGIASWIASAAALGGLLVWQFGDPPSLQRATLAQRATAVVQRTVQESDLARLVEAEARFTRADIQGQDTLLVSLYVQSPSEGDASSETIRRELSRLVKARLQERFAVTPLLDVTVLGE